jgi:hypothetical protein
MVSSGRRDPPNVVALEELNIYSTENFSSHWEVPEATGSGFAWKSATTEFTNPTGTRR